MNCNTVAENMSEFIAGNLSATLLAECRQHIRQCPDCHDALRGAQALALLRGREIGRAPDGLLKGISEQLNSDSNLRSRRSFWLGTGFGTAVAASLTVMALVLGWMGPVVDGDGMVGEFVTAIGVPGKMDLAIETDRPLTDATISIVLSSGVALDGFAGRRELNWTTDLEAGVNRLSLPVIATESGGGHMVVRLDHPQSQRVFVVRVKARA